ncbi:hypothetical protein H1R20_g11954, partial [Candolleomyces eurysporus]
MVKAKKGHCQRKATWLSFGVVALAVVSAVAATEEPTPTVTNDPVHTPFTPYKSVPSASTETTSLATTSPPEASSRSQQELDQAAEATRAYAQALTTLSALKPHPSQHVFDALLATTNDNTKSIFTSFFPNVQGQGPIGSAIRIILRLHHLATSRISSSLSKEGLGLGNKKKDEDLRTKSIKVMDLLQHSAELGFQDALYTIGVLSLFPPNQHFEFNPRRAYESFVKHAAETGNATSQSYIAFFYASGYGNIVPADQGKAQLYYSFAANGADRGAQLALGYRYWSGIGSRESCDRAMAWYGSAAEQSVAKFMTGPPGGRTLPQTSTRLSDLVGGIYGPGASVASTGIGVHRPAIKAGIARAAGETWEDVLEYYLFNADRGEIDFAYRLGKIFYQGSIYASPGGIASGSEGVGAIPRNFKLARHYFTTITRQVWPHDPPLQVSTKETENKPVGYAAASAAYLGRMYLRGEGVKADHVMARVWFERGADHGDRECQNGLGIIYRDGLVPGQRPDLKQALKYFDAAAAQDLAEAQVNLGKHYYYRGDIPLATTYFEYAVRNGSPFEAYYYLAEIHASQAQNPAHPPHVVAGSCSMAVSFYKLVAERGVWDDDLLRDAEIAWMSQTAQDKDVAMLKWAIAAERGFEVAQNNLGYILDQDKSILRLTRFSPMTPSNDTASLALTQWIRAAGQRNIDALVKVGDYYYHGLGVSADETEASRLEKAARYYQSAAHTQVSALAMWNLGWMYENGIGVPQDFHLAKRHYDLALETNSEAYLPVMLSLGKLYLKSIWHTIMGGSGGLSLWGSGDADKGSSDNRKEIDGKKAEESNGETTPERVRHQEEEEDGPWYFGRARDEFHRRKNKQGPSVPQGEEDPIQWARERRDAERDRDSDFGPEDYFEGALQGGIREDDVDEFGETMLLVLLCLTISILLYIRTRIVERMRRDQRERQPNENQGQDQGNANGVFPPPGDPAREDWAILR